MDYILEANQKVCTIILMKKTNLYLNTANFNFHVHEKNKLDLSRVVDRNNLKENHQDGKLHKLKKKKNQTK